MANYETIKELQKAMSKYGRLDYWSEILGFDIEKKESHNGLPGRLFFVKTGEDVDRFVKKNYVEQLNGPEVQAKLLGANNG